MESSLIQFGIICCLINCIYAIELNCYEPGKHPAESCEQYYECEPYWWLWYIPTLKTCPEGQTFDVSLSTCIYSGLINCQPTTVRTVPTSPTTTTTTTTVITPTTSAISANPPQCIGAFKYPSEICYQYYQCVIFLFWWVPQRMECARDEGFDTRTRKCVPGASIGCSWPIIEPTCTGPGKYPALERNRYYECVQYLWYWTPALTACPGGQNFNSSAKECQSTAALNL